MGKALDLYLAARTPQVLSRSGANPEAWRLLNEAAAEWRSAGAHFYAGYAMEGAVHAAWGDGALVNEAIRASIDDYSRCVQARDLDSHEALAALWFTRLMLRYFDPTPEVLRLGESVDRELAERLSLIFADKPGAAGCAIRGVCLSTDFDGHWDVSVPPGETVSGSTRFDGVGGHVFQLPSAFAVLRNLGDYRGMQALIDRFPGAFTTPGLRGWKVAVAGFLAPEGAADLFAQAADFFASDAAPSDAEIIAQGILWSGENIHLWAKYFRARAVLARLVDVPLRAPEMVVEAAQHLEGTESGIVHQQVTRLRILLRALVALVGKSDADSIGEAARELRSEQRVSGERDADDVASRFLAAAEAALAEFRNAPDSALASGRLAAALDALGRLPLIGPDVAEAVRPMVGQHALAVLQGPVRTWIHRTLAGINDETVLQRLFLRLAQSGLPHYAQIRHGPLEYGKDVVVLAEDKGRNVMRQHQMKCGDLTMKRWREVKDQLEEIFLVPLESVNVNKPVDDRVGILVCNGHALPNVDPVMRGWFEVQALDHGRKFEFMHLDDLANWIVRHGLVSEFRAALAEVGVKVG